MKVVSVKYELLTSGGMVETYTAYILAECDANAKKIIIDMFGENNIRTMEVHEICPEVHAIDPSIIQGIAVKYFPVVEKKRQEEEEREKTPQGVTAMSTSEYQFFNMNLY